MSIYAVYASNCLDFLAFAIPLANLPQLLNADKVGATLFGVFQAISNGVGLLSSLMMGRVSDYYGRRPIFMACLGLGLCAFLCYISSVAMSSIPLAIIGDILRRSNRNGIGGVMGALVADVSPSGERATNLGRSAAAAGFGFGLGNLIGGVLSVYGLMVPMIAGCFVVIINICIAVFLLPTPSTTHKANAQKVNTYQLTLQLLKNSQISCLLLGRFFTSIGFFTTVSSLALLCKERFGFGPAEYGMLMAAIGYGFSLCSGVLVPLVAPYLTEKQCIVFGMMFSGTGRLIMGLSTYLPLFCFGEVVVVFGNALTIGSYGSFLSKKAPKGNTGHLMGMSECLHGTAAVLAPIPGGYLYEHYGTHIPGCAACVSTWLAATIVAVLVHTPTKDEPPRPKTD